MTSKRKQARELARLEADTSTWAKHTARDEVSWWFGEDLWIYAFPCG